MIAYTNSHLFAYLKPIGLKSSSHALVVANQICSPLEFQATGRRISVLFLSLLFGRSITACMVTIPTLSNEHRYY